MKSFIITCILLTASLQTSFAQHSLDLTGHWKFIITFRGHKANIGKMHFTYKNEHYTGTYNMSKDSPYGPVSLKKIYLTKDDSVFFSFNGGAGITKNTANVANFKGIFQSDSLITGIMNQHGYSIPFKLRRYNPAITNKAPKPYHHKDVIIKSDSIQIGGTLTWPKKQKADQLVIIIKRFGFLNRNGQDVGHGPKILEPIAEYLAQHGIAAYRYDDRGIGESTGNHLQSTLTSVASDVQAMIAHFTKNPDYQFKQIILLGNGLGGIIAGKVAVEDTLVSKLILMSSPTVKYYKKENHTLKNLLKHFHEQWPQINKTIKAMDSVFKAVNDSENVAKAKNKFHREYTKMINPVVKTFPDSTRRIVKELPKGFMWEHAVPLYASMDFYNPTKDLRKLNIPVLALFGGKDETIRERINLPPLITALNSAGVSYQISVFKNADHTYLRNNAIINKQDNFKLKKHPYVKGFLATIVQWIK
jgi:alpha-beta hydrolase superfamily lysophospholipase